MGELTKIKGVGPKTEKYFSSLGIESAKDLLYYFPRDYEAYEDITEIIKLEVGKVYTVNAVVVTKPSVFRKGRVTITSCVLDDGTGRVRDGYVLSQCKIYKKNVYEGLKGSLSPIYSVTKGLPIILLKR